MPRFFDPLLRLLGCSDEQELLALVQFLKTENRMLRQRLPKCIFATAIERRRLLRFGSVLRWSVIQQSISIVTPRTFARWARTAKHDLPEYHKRGKKVGRPAISQPIRDIVIRIARETGLGYTRIQGELKKLGISLSRSTIVNILKGVGMSPDPQRGEGRWDEFLKMHAQTLWACDFLSVRGWTAKGLKQFYLILFIHIKSRRIHVTPASAHPTLPWVDRQAEDFCRFLQDNELECRKLIRDPDRKFIGRFDEIFKANGVEPICLPRRSPNLNAYAERVIQSLKHECLNHFIILGEKHLNYLVQEYVEFYNSCRPHSAVGHLPPCRDGPPSELTAGRVLCEERLGGLLKHYYREAA